MANNYESLKTDGHYTLAYRIFLKLRNWIIDFVKLERPNDPTAYTVSSEDGSVDLSGSSSSSVAYTDEYGIRHVAASSNFDLSVQEVNGHTVNSDVPANAEFTDYKSKITGSFQGVEHTDIAENLDFLNTDFVVAPGITDTETGIVYNGISLLHSVGTDVPSNAVFTDTKVTSVGNHYAPTEDSSATLSADASSTTAATWNSTSLVTGVDIKRDAKGHVTGVAVDSIKMPSNPDTNTHRPIQVNGTQILGNNTTALNLVPGDNVSMTNSSGSVTVSADQIDDTYDYDDYLDLPDSIKMQDKIFMVSGAPKPVYFRYIEETETIIFTNGYAHYNAETESISLGG